MKHVWKMLMAALLACMLLVPVSAGAEKLYGEVNRDNVREDESDEDAPKYGLN